MTNSGQPSVGGAPERSAPDPRSQEIVRAAIYPSIGIARVGNSKDGWFIGPEVISPEPEEPGFYRDSAGALKRQAARFRVYGLNAAGKVVKELNSSNAEIEWAVHLANKKAAWYQFQIALDIAEASAAPTSLLRNATVADRESLIIDPGSRPIHGRDAAAVKFDTGEFMGTTVYLGELRTDREGRLIVLGGRGCSGPKAGSRLKAITYANNEGWYDDTSDGPVTAKVRYKDRTLEVDPAWVVVAPPNFAPLRKSVRTMWDLMRCMAITAKQLGPPVRPSFENDIRPIFERLEGLQWVNSGFAASFGWKGPNNLATPGMLARLSRKDPANEALRRTIANQFRNFDRDSIAAQPWPWLWGDAYNAPPLSSRAFCTLSDTQLAMLAKWADGDFDEDYQPGPPKVRQIEQLHERDQADMLTRAALEFCLADAFHPGCEMTWPMRRASMYMSPFRIAHARDDYVEPGFGPQLTHEIVTSRHGPCGAQLPGGLTRWMAVPWQTDTASCDSGFDGYDPHVPAFWPARVPNQVLPHEKYAAVMNKKLPMAQRLAAFADRKDWIRPLGSDYIKRINLMISNFHELGIVEQRQGPGDAEFPGVIEVESQPTPAHAALTAANGYSRAEWLGTRSTIEKARRLTKRPLLL